MDEQILTNAIDALERVLQVKEDEIAGIRRSLMQLRGVSQDPDTLPPPRTNEWEKLGITKAAQLWLAEVKGPRETREIADAIRDRGVRTQSKDFVTTVYSTLANARTKFVRTGDGRNGKWGLVR